VEQCPHAARVLRDMFVVVPPQVLRHLMVYAKKVFTVQREHSHQYPVQQERLGQSLEEFQNSTLVEIALRDFIVSQVPMKSLRRLNALQVTTVFQEQPMPHKLRVPQVPITMRPVPRRQEPV